MISKEVEIWLRERIASINRNAPTSDEATEEWLMLAVGLLAMIYLELKRRPPQ